MAMCTTSVAVTISTSGLSEVVIRFKEEVMKMISVRFLTFARQTVLVALISINFMSCTEEFLEGVSVFCMNNTTSNFHINSKNGQRVKQGEVSEYPIAFVMDYKDLKTKKRLICRDYGCFAEIEISYIGDPDPRWDGPYQDTVVVVEDPQTGDLSAYSLLGFVGVSIRDY